MHCRIIIPENSVSTERAVWPPWNTTEPVLFSGLLTTRLLEGMQLDDNLNVILK